MNNETKKQKKGRQLRGGAYSIVICLVILALAFAINLFAGELPSSVMELDTTSHGLFTLSEQTRQIAAGLEADVELYLVCQAGNEDIAVGKLVDRYGDVSPRITVRKVDPAADPALIRQFTSGAVEDNSIIVKSGQRSTIVYNRDIYTYIYDEYYQTSIDAFNGENVITSAISFVTSKETPVLYVLGGHGGPELTGEMQAAIERENMRIEQMNLAGSSVPEDAACVLLYSPEKDLTAEESPKLLEYLDGGGRLVLTTDYATTAMPNLKALVNGYGMDFVEGIVVEGDDTMMISGYNHYILPNLADHEITKPLIEGGSRVVMPVATGISILEQLRSTLAVSPLLTTSDASYSKLAGTGMTNFIKEEGDVDGPFNLAVAASEEYGGKEARMVWFSNSNFLVEGVDDSVAGANMDLFLNALGWLTEKESGISIRAKELNMDHITMSNAQGNAMSIVIMAVLPLAIIAVGIVVVIRRRRRA